MEKLFFNFKKTKISINARLCKSIWSKFAGLMFRKKSKPLLFIFNQEKILEIHSFFCKPFMAIWLDKNKNTTKIAIIKEWRIGIGGFGKYLLEIPSTDENYWLMTKLLDGKNRKI